MSARDHGFRETKIACGNNNKKNTHHKNKLHGNYTARDRCGLMEAAVVVVVEPVRNVQKRDLVERAVSSRKV